MPKKSTKATTSKPSKSTTTASKPEKQQQQQQQQQRPPNWPPIQPTLPLAGQPLTLTPHPASPTKIITIPTFFPRSLCRSYVAFLRTLPLTTTPATPKRRGDAVRVNDRFQVDDAAFAERLWAETGLREGVGGVEGGKELWGGEVIGLNPNIRVYRYIKGHFFDCHYDETNHTTLPSPNPPSSAPIPVKTTWTLLLYLTSSTEGCEGGETVFYTHDRRSAREEILVRPETGMVLLHKHGDDCLLHEGREVTAGEKWILRTDLCVRK